MKNIKFFIEYFFLYYFIIILQLFPLKFNLCLSSFIGKILFYLNKKHRDIALKNLRSAFPDKSEIELIGICKKLYINLTKVFIEFLYLPKLDHAYYQNKIQIEGLEHLNNALKLNHGIVAITSHLDNWELLGAIVVTRGYSLEAIYHPMRNPLTDRIINRIRERAGISLIPMETSLKPILRSLKNNNVVGFIADQDAGRDGIFVNFLNRQASTFKGPALFAIKTKAPMILFTLIREPNDNHRLVIGPPLQTERTGDLQTDIYKYTKRWTEELEKWIKKYPEQWFWVHRKWQTRPESEK